MLATFLKNVDEKSVSNISKKCWRKNVRNISEKYLWKKYWQQFKKLLIQEIKKSKCEYLGGLESVRWVVFVLNGLYSSHPYPPSGSYIGAPVFHLCLLPNSTWQVCVSNANGLVVQWYESPVGRYPSGFKSWCSHLFLEFPWFTDVMS
jgi:hypothetical protein